MKKKGLMTEGIESVVVSCRVQRQMVTDQDEVG